MATPTTPREARTSVRVFLTSDEGNMAVERGFLDAREEIWVACRCLDPEVPLRSAQARQHGDTWLALIRATLARGVTLNLALPDHDVLDDTDAHRANWRCMRLLRTAAEEAGAADRLTVTVTPHPARAGLISRLRAWPQRRRAILAVLAELNALEAAERENALRDLPGLSLWLRRGTDERLRAALFPLPTVPRACHNQQLFVFDRREMFLGAIDQDPDPGPLPVAVAGDGMRGTAVPLSSGRQSRHGVSLLKQGPAVAEAQAHLETYRDVVGKGHEPGPQRRILRTLSRRRTFFTPGYCAPVASELATAHEALARRAERLIYIETHAFEDLTLTQHLTRAASRNPDLGMILMLPGTEAPPRQTEALQRLLSGFGDRIFVGQMISQRTEGRHMHNRVSIFDTRTAVVSSADLTTRGLHCDTELGIFLRTPRDVNELSRRVMAHWLPRGASSECFSDTTAVAAWRAVAEEEGKRGEAERRGRLLPYVSKS